MVETFNPSTLNLTEGAVNKIHSLSDSDKSKEINLRVYVTGGGCSGFQYEWGFVELKDIAKDDEVIDFGTGKFVIDGTSVMYVAGTEINFKKEVFGSHFEIKNPSAKSSCGCGESFAV